MAEGHHKVWARLRYRGFRTSKRRVLRLMREAGLLSRTRAGRVRGSKTHDGTIIPERPDELWGTNASSTLTSEGNATIFFVLDHCTAERLGIHAAQVHVLRLWNPINQSVETCFGSYSENVASGSGLALRHDHGSQFISDVFQDELIFLGFDSSPSFVKKPEGNSEAERFVRTLKEQLLWLRWFETVDDLNEALQEFKARYNIHWLF